MIDLNCAPAVTQQKNYLFIIGKNNDSVNALLPGMLNPGPDPGRSGAPAIREKAVYAVCPFWLTVTA